MEFKGRLKYLLGRDGITAYRIWKDTSITKGTITNYIEGKTNPNRSNISILAIYFKVNEEWLAKGIGEISRNDTAKGETPYLVTKSGVKYYEMPNGKYRMRVSFIPVKTYAKYIDEYRDAEFLSGEFDEFDFIVDKIGHGRYFAFEIKGDSMDDDSKRSLCNGDIVLARELGKEHWCNKLHTGNFPNWIIVLDNTVLCKQISGQDTDKGTITCHSLNASPEYTDFNLKLDKICQLCNIVQRVSSVF
jgi:transcriptional regulator with XRE-family HTH domain